MARLNTKKPVFEGKTHEGAPAKRINYEQQLRRSVMSCLLWEREFYEGGEDISKRIWSLCERVPAAVISEIAIEARHQSKLRHVPLLLIVALVRKAEGHIEDTIYHVVTRVDQMAELLSMYWATPDNKHMIPHAMQRGLQRAFARFDEYQLSKYNPRGVEVKLRDVIRIVRPKPEGIKDGRKWVLTPKAQSALWKKVVKGTLKTADTWETALSGGADKKETFERLIREGNLGYFALLRNLRNMMNSGVDDQLVRDAIVARKNGADKVLPFRFIAAARAAPQWERELDKAMLESIKSLPPMSGQTMVMVDVSGSMDYALSGKSDLKRIDAAAALASIINCDKLAVVTFSDNVVQVPPRRGMAGVDVIMNSQPHNGTQLGAALAAIRHNPMDRLIVITDEQSHDRVGDPPCKNAYMINVASAKNGVGYGAWRHVDGFSENVLRWIVECEKNI